MKNFFRIFIIIIYWFSINSAFAQDESQEIIIKGIFQENYKLVFINPDTSKYNIAIDYSIEILKKIPNSYEAIFTINCLNKLTLPGKQDYIQKKYDELFLKFSNDLEDPYNDIVEKLILSTMFYHGIGNSLTSEEAEKNFEAGFKFLLQIKDGENKNYAPLACLLLAYTKPNLGVKYYIEFKEKFKDHLAIPFVDMHIIYTEYCLNQNDYLKAIKLLNDLIKTNDITTPLGHIKLDYFELIIECYIEMHDYINAATYLEKIKNEEPNYWNIKNIENAIKISGKK